MYIKIPELSLVLLVGASSSGKSSFARKHFKASEIISSDFCRYLVSDDENDLNATNDAFDVLDFIARKRLKRGLLTVIDATNVRPEDRKKLINIAKDYHTLAVALVFDMPEKVLLQRHANRIDRNFHKNIIINHKINLQKGLKKIRFEGFINTIIFKNEEEINLVEGITREKLWNNKKDETSPLDIIGDVHGCFLELKALLEKLNYKIDINHAQNAEVIDKNINENTYKPFIIQNPDNRKVVFLGDLTDRGNYSPDVLRLVMQMVEEEKAYCVMGNHDAKLLKHLQGKNVTLTHGLDKTVAQLAQETPQFNEKVKLFLQGLISHYIFDNGNLITAHAGIREEMQGRGSATVKNFCMYGETTGEIDEFGLPVRYNWASEYQGKGMVIYGHTPIPQPQWLNNTLNIDTGCVFGGNLTALRYPEKELVSVPAQEVYAIPTKPLQTPQETQKQHDKYDDVLDIAHVLGKRIIQNSFASPVTIREENTIKALEVMSRYALNPHWLMYLPPTMSPTEVSTLPNFLEYPTEGFAYYKKQGITQVVCQEKQMGSRVVIVICKEKQTPKTRFNLQEESLGVCYTRTGRHFFKDKTLENRLLERLNIALSKANFWEKQQTDWVCLDAELMPWSAKAQELIKTQYASTATSAYHALADVMPFLEKAKKRGIDITDLSNTINRKKQKNDQYTHAFRQYCKQTNSIEDYSLAPFHILATENQTHTDKTHVWHIETIADFCQYDNILHAIPYKLVDLTQEESIQNVTNWWLDITAKGSEGMVIKPLHFLAYDAKGHLIQPAIKCRGKEYLRIIYGADYDTQFDRLKKRGLTQKRSMAMREFILGIEGLKRFVEKNVISRIHECVFGVLALESEEVDPRL